MAEDFDAHLKYMEGFHKRYMASNAFCRRWVKMVSSLDVEHIAPQHGALIKGRENVKKFLAWFENLACGVDVLDDIYGR